MALDLGVKTVGRPNVRGLRATHMVSQEQHLQGGASELSKDNLQGIVTGGQLSGADSAASVRRWTGNQHSVNAIQESDPANHPTP